MLWITYTKLCVHPTIVSKTIKIYFGIHDCVVVVVFPNDLSLSLSLFPWLTLSRASYELEMCRRDGVWAGNQYSARYMEVCNLITLSFSGLSLNRPNQTSQPELYYRYHPISSILRHTKANNITQGRHVLILSNFSILYEQ